MSLADMVKAKISGDEKSSPRPKEGESKNSIIMVEFDEDGGGGMRVVIKNWENLRAAHIQRLERAVNRELHGLRLTEMRAHDKAKREAAAAEKTEENVA